jgi:hypothetical protein
MNRRLKKRHVGTKRRSGLAIQSVGVGHPMSRASDRSRSTGKLNMTKFAWVAVGMLVAGLGGAAATWGSMCLMHLDLQQQPDDVYRSLTAAGGVFAGLCGGVVSIGRGNTRDRTGVLAGVAALALGIIGTAVINAGLLFAPFVLVVAPLQGLAALLGGLAAVAALWACLWFAGIREDAAPTGSPGSPLGTAGLVLFALSLILPLITDVFAVDKATPLL